MIPCNSMFFVRKKKTEKHNYFIAISFLILSVYFLSNLKRKHGGMSQKN